MCAPRCKTQNLSSLAVLLSASPWSACRAGQSGCCCARLLVVSVCAAVHPAGGVGREGRCACRRAGVPPLGSGCEFFCLWISLLLRPSLPPPPPQPDQTLRMSAMCLPSAPCQSCASLLRRTALSWRFAATPTEFSQPSPGPSPRAAFSPSRPRMSLCLHLGHIPQTICSTPFPVSPLHMLRPRPPKAVDLWQSLAEDDGQTHEGHNLFAANLAAAASAATVAGSTALSVALVLLGQKLGSPLLPKSIPVDDFDALVGGVDVACRITGGLCRRD